jgi:hypothetical protein
VTLEDFKKLPIWQQMTSTVGAKEIALVEAHVSYILPQMEHYVDTFPTYTLHNRAHISNVVRIMGDLLAGAISALRGMEAMILILSAIYHDYGMVYSPEERQKIASYDDFQREFLIQNVHARVQFEENKQVVSKELAEWYCRWAHAKRVWLKLAETEPLAGTLQWKDMPIRDFVGHVCESHNEPAENIRIDDSRFPSALFGECDLRFCALILRLADILDFDNSRSPKSVYDFLDLGNPKNHSEQVSQAEWLKHMDSLGFKFNGALDRSPLRFIAKPTHPSIETGIRNVLDLIDLELAAAAKVSHLCSDRWHDFPFPNNINRDDIISVNYVSGKFRFSLSEDKILDLLTGDNLYNDDWVFIRELLQNAIDTVRHRTFIEKINNPKYTPTSIEVSYFKDEEGYYWLRIDDCGMGMNHAIITKYFLSKGTSYYQSDEFKLQKILIQEKEQNDFVPISRFGIGLLSCFMTCDKIEVNTCYFYAPEAQTLEKTRLSIESRAGYWVIRSDKMHHTADKMPSVRGWERGYRDTVGTSIACRIMTTREFRGMNMEANIERFLLAPEIPVIFHGKQLGGDRQAMAMKPWCEHSTTPLPDEFRNQCSTLIQKEVQEIIIEIRPIDLAKMAADINLAGQLVVVIPRITVKSDTKHFSVGQHFKLQEDGTAVFIICEMKKRDENGHEVITEARHEITEIVNRIHFPDKFIDTLHHPYRFQYPRVSHNGIVVYDNEHQLQLYLPNFDQFSAPFHRQERFILSTGLYCFRDALLPELVVSRSVIKELTPAIIANIWYATREMNEYTAANEQPFRYLPDMELKQRRSSRVFSIQEFEQMNLYQRDVPYWHDRRCIALRDKSVTIAEALTLAKEGPIIFRIHEYHSKFYTEFLRYIIIKNFAVRYIPDLEGWFLQGRLNNPDIKIPTELYPFTPMQFIESVTPENIVLDNRSLNLQHPLVKWIVSRFDLIKRDFSYYGYQLFNVLLGQDTAKSKATAVNEILARLRVLLPPDARPSQDLDIKDEDIK